MSKVQWFQTWLQRFLDREELLPDYLSIPLKELVHEYMTSVEISSIELHYKTLQKMYDAAGGQKQVTSPPPLGVVCMKHSGETYVDLQQYDCILIIGDSMGSLYRKTCEEIHIPKCFQWDMYDVDRLVCMMHKRQEMLMSKRHNLSVPRPLLLFTEEDTVFKQLKGYVDLARLDHRTRFTGIFRQHDYYRMIASDYSSPPET